ncbi:hypothetical protein [Paenibacillus macerans]|nr:hypothetical protein [Paenibacillus macerans]
MLWGTQSFVDLRHLAPYASFTAKRPFLLSSPGNAGKRRETLAA